MDEYKAEILKKRINKQNTIIVFDEAHFNTASYQKIQAEMINAGFCVIRMSATFAGLPFSSNSTYKIRSYYTNYLDTNQKVQLGDNMITLEELFTKHRGIVFTDNLTLNQKQQEALVDRNVSHVVLTKDFNGYEESVTYGLQDGSVVVGNDNHEMGLTM